MFTPLSRHTQQVAAARTEGAHRAGDRPPATLSAFAKGEEKEASLLVDLDMAVVMHFLLPFCSMTDGGVFEYMFLLLLRNKLCVIRSAEICNMHTEI